MGGTTADAIRLRDQDNNFPGINDVEGALKKIGAFENGGSLTPLAQEFYSSEGRANQLPVFTKYASNPILVPGQNTLETMQWPWVIRVDDKIVGPLAKFYLYYSTDHGNSYAGVTTANGVNAQNSAVVNVASVSGFNSGGGVFMLLGWAVSYTGVSGSSFTGCSAHPATTGGETAAANLGGRVGLAYANSPLGPWTAYAGAGVGNCIFQDTDGTETETVSVVWDDETSQFFMFYHQVGTTGETASGVTKLATSPDGITWTKVGIVLDVPDASHWFQPFPTYFRPFKIGSQWYGFSLAAGGNWPRHFLWYSHDGQNWQLDQRYLGYNADLLTDPANERVSQTYGTPFFWNGRMWWLGSRVTMVSGPTIGVATFCFAEMSPDFRILLGKPKDIACFASQQGWEDTFYAGISLLIYQGVLYLYYRSNASLVFGGTGEGFGVASAPIQAVAL